MELADKEILIKIKSGEIDYFSHIVKRYAGIIDGYLKSKLFDKVEADDLAQNTFLSFYKSVSRFDPSRPILPYLFEIAKNELKMYFRSRKKTVSLDDNIKLQTEDRYGFEKDSIDDLSQFVSEDQRKVLKFLYDGYSYREISKEIKKPLNTVRTLIRRARLKLIKTYEKT